MALIILKIIITSSVLLGFYHIFLGREGSFKFNRFFLILSLVFAYITPFIAFDLPQFQSTNATLIFGETMADFRPAATSGNQSVSFENLFLMIYAFITLTLFVKSLRAFLKIRFLQGENIIYKDQKLTILSADVQPFSFFGIIYLSRKDCNGGEIDERIYLHEKCHVQQYHSLDLLFLELFSIFSWFNPALIFYKKAMLSNHEFLADDYVLKNNFDVQKYQHLILSKMELSSSFHLTHPFNFNNTKKRFMMMTTKNSRFSWLKKIALLPLFAMLFLLFTKKVNAQTEMSSLVEPASLPNKGASISFEEKSAPKSEQKIIVFSKKKIDDIEVKTDTIQKKQEVDALTPPPPPPPREFDQVPAEYPGGPNTLRSLVSKNFDTSIFTGNEGLIKTTVYLSIDKKGKISNIFAEGDNIVFNAEAVRAVTVANEGKLWKPATENSTPVKSVYKLPLTMKFETPVKK